MLTYTYTVIKTDILANMMEVEFSADGYDTLLVGMPLPEVGSVFLDHISMYAPVPRWLESKKTLAAVTCGTTGVVTYDPSTATSAIQLSATPADVIPATATPTFVPVTPELMAKMQAELPPVAPTIV